MDMASFPSRRNLLAAPAVDAVYAPLGPLPHLPAKPVYPGGDRMYAARCYSAMSYEGLVAMANSSSDPDRDSVLRDLKEFLAPGDSFNYLFDPKEINNRKGARPSRMLGTSVT